MNYLKRWLPAAGSEPGLEYVSRALSSKQIVAALRPVLVGIPTATSFLIARVGTTDQAGVSQALRSTESLGSAVRICLALNASTLTASSPRLPSSDVVSFMLDDVSQETPLSLIVRDDIEAIRFLDSFVDSASTNLRVNCALRAMLSLSQDLAISTFGSPALHVPVHERPPFDFVGTRVAGVEPSSHRRPRSMDRQANGTSFGPEHPEL